LHEFDAAQQYARQQGWLVEAGKAFSTMLTPAGLEGRKGGIVRGVSYRLSASMTQRAR
jgi:hypothetical protein